MRRCVCRQALVQVLADTSDKILKSSYASSVAASERDPGNNSVAMMVV